MAESNNITAAEAKRAARNAGALAVASIISKAALFGWQIILAPWLGVADYGVYGTVGALFAIAAALPNFGMGPIVIRDVARAPKLAGKYLTATLYMQTVLALLAYVGVNIAAAAMDSSEAVRAFTAVAGLSLLIDILGNMCFDILLARERMVTTSAIEIGHILLRIVLSWVLLVAGFGLMGVYVATLLTGLGRSLLLWFLLWRDDVRPQWPLDRTIAKALFFNGLPLALSAFLTLAFQQIDKLMSTSLIGEVGTGYLTAAFVIIFGVVNLMSTTILTAVFPLMSRVYGDGDNPLFGFMVEKLTIFTLMANLPIALTISLFSTQLTVPIFGEDFAPTAGVLAVLIWYALLNMISAVLSRGLVIQNRQRNVLIIRSVGLGSNILLNALLLPRIGVTGAAVASVLAELIITVGLFFTLRATGLSWWAVAPRIVRLMIVSLLTLVIMALVGAFQTWLAIAIGLVVYVLGVLFGSVISSEDWDLLYRLVAAMPGGGYILRYWRRDVSLNW